MLEFEQLIEILIKFSVRIIYVLWKYITIIIRNVIIRNYI